MNFAMAIHVKDWEQSGKKINSASARRGSHPRGGDCEKEMF